MTGKIVIVTGAADGIGFGIARAFGRAGAVVIMADIDADGVRAAADALVSEGHAVEAVTCDVADPVGVERLFAATASRHGRLDVLVNNAGIVVQVPTQDMTLDQWNRMIAVNLTGPFLTCQAARPLMARQGGGAIVNIASVGGYASAPGFAGYGATKGGILSLTRALAVEWGPDNIRVNSVSPGSVGTAMSLRSKEVDPAAYERRLARVPLKRVANVGDVAEAVLYLSDERSGYVSGTDIKVDGAIMAQHPGYVA